MPVIEEAVVVLLAYPRLKLARPLTVSAWLRTLIVPVTPLKSMLPDPRLPFVGEEPMEMVFAFRMFVPDPSLIVWTAVPAELSPRPIRFAVMVLAGDRIIVAAPPLVPPVCSPRRKMPAAPAFTVKLANAVMSTVSVEELVEPVAPPTWKSAPFATKAPPSVKFTLEMSLAATFEPSVFVPVVVSVRPVPMRMTAEAAALFVPVAIPPIVWSKESTSSVAVGVAADAVEALPSTIVAFGENVLAAAPVTLPATTITSP